MKRLSLFSGIFFATLVFQGCSDASPKPTGLPGDNLDLYAVLDLFKSSASIENFEKSLNDKSNKVNNLDLNGDGKVDYIRVIDKGDASAHAFVLRVPVSKDESQDMAVIEIEKTGDKTASIQLIGDEDMYGKDFIIEPKDGNNEAGFIYASTSIGVNVWLWPSVIYVYSPEYVVWVSPYYYDYYPAYWSPWEPIAFEIYSPIFFKNHGQYVSYEKRRFKHAHEMYYSNRMYSGFVIGRQKNGEFHEGKQERYKGTDFPKGNSGNEKQDGENKKQENGFGNQKGNETHGNSSSGNNDKKGNTNKKETSPNTSGKQKGNDQKVQNHSQKNSGSNSPKSSAPKGSNQKPKGGGGKHK